MTTLPHSQIWSLGRQPVSQPLVFATPQRGFDIHRLYDRVAEDYSRDEPKFRDDLISRPLVVELAKTIGAGKDVIDIGCGDGHISRLISAAAGRVLGVDISRSMLMLARRKAVPYRNLSFREANFLNLEAVLPKRRFELALGIYALCCLRNKNQLDWAFRSVYRILIDGGTAIVQVPDENESSWKSKSEWIEESSWDVGKTTNLVNRWLRTIDDNWVQVARYRHSPEDYFDSMQKAGFYIEDVLEPRPSSELLQEFPSLAHEAEVTSSLVFILKK